MQRKMEKIAMVYLFFITATKSMLFIQQDSKKTEHSNLYDSLTS